MSDTDRVEPVSTTDETVNGGGEGAAVRNGTANPQLEAAIAEKIASIRDHVRESFAKAVMAMMLLPRYRHLAIGDLQHIVLEPLMRDRLAIAQPGDASKAPVSDIVGVAIWASVSEEVDARIREQIGAGVFPVRLQADDWTSGSINWLLDVIAPNARATASVIANFRQVVKDGNLRLHPLVTRLVDEETLKKLGAQRISAGSAAEPSGNA